MTEVLDQVALTGSGSSDKVGTTRAHRGKNRLHTHRVYTTPGKHPYDEVTWEQRDVVMTNWRDGSVNFEQRGVEFPTFWSVNAANIVTTKYFRGAVGHEGREYSLKQLINRVVGKYVEAGKANKYFATPEDAETFEAELTYMLLHQVFSFNSPVWFNVGTTAPQQVSACFILAVDDNMDSILNWYREEGMIFKGGSGAGLNLSRIRSSKELLSSGGTASGPVSFMRGADASAGTIKSGGATRRAAKMVVLDVDHPDIEEFIETKAREEDKIRALRDAGFDMDLGGKDIVSVQYQNANNSVRVSDDFMRAVETGSSFGLRARGKRSGEGKGEVLETVDARTLWRKLAQAAWECADPGIQYDDTINDWHTNMASGRITASNPCSEYMSLDNTSCNLASLNLMTFLNDDGTFAAKRFAQAVEIIITAMDISICFADFPTPAIGTNTRAFRQLGIGYANLGALLMATGHAYDSDGGRALAGAITSLMTGTAYKRSAELAAVVGPYEGYAANADFHLRVMRKHAAANQAVRTVGADDEAILKEAKAAWEACLTLGVTNGYRNAQASVIAPTGTIGLMMDCDTTGLEPDLALVKFKKLVGGGSMQIVNQTVPRALKALGYSSQQVVDIVEYIGGVTDADGNVVKAGHGHVVDAPGLKPEHYSVFDCAMGARPIAAMGHVHMMAAIQPFVSGALSKTVNLPAEATVEEVENVYFQGWKLGLKALAIYRNNSKVGQPLQDKKDSTKEAVLKVLETTAVDQHGRHVRVLEQREDGHIVVEAEPTRRRLPKKRKSETVSFNVAGAEGYMTHSWYPEEAGEKRELGEVFIKMSKQGSTLAGVMDAFSVSISIGLQYGVPLRAYVSKFVNMRFDPAGMVMDDEDIKMAGSVMDYLFRRLALDYMTLDERQEFGIASIQERTQAAQVYDAPAASADAHNGYGNGPVATSVSPAPVATATTADGLAGPMASPHVVGTAPSEAHSSMELLELQQGTAADAPLCMTCGVKMRPAGSCYVCESCGSTSGCS